jgi:hypothetical protein
MTTTHSHPEYLTREELDARLELLVARFDQHLTDLELRLERAMHAQTRQMFLLLVPVYGGIIVSLLIFLASKVL